MAKKHKPRRRPTQKKATPSPSLKERRPYHVTNAQRQRQTRHCKELVRAVESAEHRLYLLRTGQINRETAQVLTTMANRSQTTGRSA